MDPVAELTGEEFSGKEGKLLSEPVLEFFDSFNNVVHNDVVGDVILDKKAIESDISHGMGRMKAIAFAAVPDMIKYGKVVDYQINRKSRKSDSIVLAVRFTVSGGKYSGNYYGACVLNVDDDNQLYFHEVYAIKTDGNSPFKSGPANNRRLPAGDSHPSILSIFE